MKLTGVYVHDPIRRVRTRQRSVWRACTHTRYDLGMAARETHTTARPVRISDEDWTDFGALVGDRERSHVLREFIAWYLRRPKAKLPARPAES